MRTMYYSSIFLLLISAIISCKTELGTSRPIPLKEPNISKLKPLNLDEIKSEIGYPWLADCLGIEGAFLYELEVGVDGEVVSFRLIKGIDLPVLTPILEEYIPKILFEPLDTINTPIYSKATVSFWFTKFQEGLYPGPYYVSGMKALDKSLYHEAIEYFTSSIKFNHLFTPHSYVQRIVAYIKIKDFEQSKKDLKYLLTHHTMFVELWLNETLKNDCSMGISLITDPNAFEFERQTLKKLLPTGIQEIDDLIDQVLDLYSSIE